MDELALSVRQARPVDAADLARIYIESWQDTYAGVLSNSLLYAMSHKGQAARVEKAFGGKQSAADGTGEVKEATGAKGRGRKRKGAGGG